MVHVAYGKQGTFNQLKMLIIINTRYQFLKEGRVIITYKLNDESMYVKHTLYYITVHCISLRVPVHVYCA